MSYLTEAFKALDALNEETFSVSDDGIKKLAEFETDDDLFDEITVFDADADDTEDLEDSYVGKVIVDCNVCHSKIYKDKSDVVIDEETQNANIDEECPYCYSTDGFKVIGEVAPMTTETEEEVEVEDDLDESLNEDTDSSELDKLTDYIKTSFKGTGIPFKTIKHEKGKTFSVTPKENRDYKFSDLDEIESYLETIINGYDTEISLSDHEDMLITFITEKYDNDNIPLRKGLGYLEKYVEPTNSKPQGIEYNIGDVVNGYEIVSYLQPKKGYRYKDKYPLVLTRNEKGNEYVEKIITDINKPELALFGVVDLTDFEIINESKSIKEGLFGKKKNNKSSKNEDTEMNEDKTYIDAHGGFGEPGEKITFTEIKKYWDDNSDTDPILQDYDSFEDWFKETKQNYLTEIDESLKESKSLEKRDIFCTDCDTVTTQTYKGEFKDGHRTLGRYICDRCGSENEDEPLKESVDLLTRENTIASVLSRHMDELSEYTDATSMRNAIIDILDKSEIADKDAVKKLKRVLFSKKSTGALLSTIATYMTGEKVAKVGKPIKEDITEKTIDELEDFINETKRRFPGSEAIYDGDTNTIQITLDEKTINEDLGTDIDEYQQWVDYDMKRYGKISDQTNKEIKEAGLQVVKDKYGDYQVIAGKYDESLKESVDSSEINKLSDYIKTSFEGTSIDFKNIQNTKGTSFVVIPELGNEYTSTEADEIDAYLDTIIEGYYTDISLTEDSEMIIEFIADEENESLKESVKDVTITTDDSKTTMISEDDGKVTVTTEPVEKHQDDEVIEPLTDETEAEIVANDGEEDIDIEDFDEESFDELGEGYFKKVYENVNSFKTSNVSTKDNKVIVEGIVTFDNNIKKSTKFIFESFSKKNNKYRMIGENVNITKGNKAFSLMGSIKDKKFLSESLNYNYRTKNDIGKSTRCLGTVRRG